MSFKKVVATTLLTVGSVAAGNVFADAIEISISTFSTATHGTTLNLESNNSSDTGDNTITIVTDDNIQFHLFERNSSGSITQSFFCAYTPSHPQYDLALKVSSEFKDAHQVMHRKDLSGNCEITASWFDG